MIPDDWVDESTLELFNSADTYYALLLPCLLPIIIIHFILIEIGLEFFINN
ncbi:hypothetical protein Mgra_00001344 [Meloidogyne graminicola]|uniref:Uncharacterized protein n=1 Tax=Meloidogyne graminicola TaxID=189291 RepID=A0A8S9ZZI2_9BILA|nr:hypothetical protein Mgra_00001344 [Meloidogyne graminicola]